ncbi:hypothetical protein BROUX41_005790 [Berkeleyomyces rouxiae]|uniref:uncharacterized protein n=1 Tax=Berkeleyomyces rouxiae TaxID=2035830 RepID=UPI003B77D9D8
MSTHNPRAYNDMISKHHHHHQNQAAYGLPPSQFSAAPSPHQGHIHASSQLHGQAQSPNSNMMFSFLPTETSSGPMNPLGHPTPTLPRSSTSTATSIDPSNVDTPNHAMGIASTGNMGIGMGVGMGISDQSLSTPPASHSTSASILQRSSRPCDTCRVRKTRCVRQDNAAQCILCAFHNKQCTYLRGPPPRGSGTSVTRHKNKEKVRTTAKDQAKVQQSGASILTTIGTSTLSASVAPETLTTALPTTRLVDTSRDNGNANYEGASSTQTAETFDAIDTTSPVVDSSLDSNTGELEYDRSMSILKGEYHVPSPESPQSQQSSQSPQSLMSDFDSNSHGSPLSSNSSPKIVPSLNGTLGLSLATHPEYIGPTSHREPALLDLQRCDPNSPAGSSAGSDHSSSSLSCGYSPVSTPVARRIDDRTMFLIYPDQSAASEEKRLAECDAVEACVRPLGRALVDLYFRIVHPSYPVLHKKVFISEHNHSHRCFTPSLLAAVYLIALDYQLYDPNMASGMMQLENPNGPAELETILERTLTNDLNRPKISTLQAGLLVLQRHKPNGVSSNWMFTAQIVALAQGLGLHVDCSAWEIPEWEKGLRRRLGWALYVQDRWGVFSHGRLRLLSEEDWDLQPCTTADFPESSALDEDPTADGNIEVDAGRQLFIKQVELAGILNEVMTLFYTSSATKPGGSLDRMGVVQAVEMARPVMIRLREWRNSLPPKLQLDCIEDRKLSANGSLHLALAATEAALHRALVRLLTSSSPPELINAVRNAATNRVIGSIGLLKTLRPEHLGAFWGGASAHQVAMIGSLAGLLWATSANDAEIAWRKGMMTELRWVLRVRGQASSFIREALRVLEKDLGRVGEIIPGQQ